MFFCFLTNFVFLLFLMKITWYFYYYCMIECDLTEISLWLFKMGVLWTRCLASVRSPHLHFPEGQPGRISGQRRGVWCYLKPGELPHVSDDQVGGRDEEVADSLESRSDGVMHFAYAGLRNHLRAMKKRRDDIEVLGWKLAKILAFLPEPESAWSDSATLFASLCCTKQANV